LSGIGPAFIDSVRFTREIAASRERTGVAFGVSAYLLWGAFPLFFPLLKPAGAVEILAHRVVWSLGAAVLVLAVARRFGSLRAVLRDRRKRTLLTIAAVLIAVNWGTFIYAVNAGHVIESSLGYFVTPLVSVAFGVWVFHERLRAAQLAALGVAACGGLVLTAAYGRVPWIALVLALSFGGYGLVKKLADVGAAESLAIETFVLLVPAAVYIVVIEASGSGTFTHHAPGHALLLAACGPVTALPLLFFAGAVIRVPLSIVGMLQYLTPTLQFLIGLLIRGEAMPTSRWIGFVLVWIALAMLGMEGLRRARRVRASAPAGPAAPELA
jgi:chloramphenicol-sensitive protein RarD